MKHFFYVLLLLFSSEMIAQEFTISGNLVDEQNNAIAFATVLVLDEAETVITGTSSLETGSFTIKNLEAKNYILKVSFVGYSNFQEAFILSEDKNFGTLILKEDAEALGEVTINATRPTLKKEADRLVFNVANTALSEGNLLEVLRSTPGVLILDNAITVKNSTPTVFINDRKVNLSAGEITQLLENSPANTIKKVEVITNPPAKYDAESGTVLNIVMSRNLITGYRGNVFSNYTQGVFPRMNAGINQFYKTKKVNLNINYSYTQKKINRDNVEQVNYLNNNNIEQQWQTNLNRNTTSKTHNANLNFDYFINDRNTLSVSSNLLFLPFFDYKTQGNSQINDLVGTNDFSFNSNNFSQDNKYNIGLDLDFKHSFKNQAKLLLNAHVTKYDYNRNQNVNSDYFLANGNFDRSSAFNTVNNQITDIFTSQLDYKLPINDSSNFSAGLKSSDVKTESDITQFDVNTTTGSQTLDLANTNAFHYDEAIFAGYLSYDKSWEKWTFSGGVRAEQTNIESVSNTSVKNKQDYLEWFPTTNLSFQASEKLNIYTNYKRSIERPSYQLLNPFNFFLNDNTIVTGNPNLQPAFINHFVIGTSISERYFIEAYYKNTNNQINELPLQNNATNQIVYSPTNIGNTKEFGFDFVTYFDVVDNWSVYFVTSFYNIKDEAVFNNNVLKLDQWSNYSVLSNDFLFLKDKSLTANFTVTYISKNQQGFLKVDTRIVTDLSLKKKLFNKKATLSLAFADLLNEQDFKVTSKYLNQDNSNFANLDNRYIKLGFSYKFGNTSLKTNERSKQLKERDRLEKN